jgi:glycosyltransferase involved in cell wall biosynthesis
MIKQGILIPVYNHGKAAGEVVEKLKPLDLPIIMVDDGCDSQNKSFLETIYSSCSLVVPVILKKNRGKGDAFFCGIKKADELGISHILQIDADGQHDTESARLFLKESQVNPQALICSFPVYDDSAPSSRKNGRKVANTWAKIVTLSPEIKESLLGFRVYPVKPTLDIFRRSYIDSRMGFDIDILVRLYWKKLPLIFHPVKVTYPLDGISHFRLFWDNVRISWCFTRLCCGMILRLPVLVFRAIRRNRRKQ